MKSRETVDAGSRARVLSDRARGVHGAEKGSSSAPAPLISVRDLQKTFTRADGTRVPAIDGVSFDLFPRELMVLLGPSGCGKTTLLRAVAGLETPDEGEISIRGVPAFSSRRRLNVAPENRGISIVFQSYALWPHMTGFENVAYPMRARRAPRDQIVRKVTEVLDMVGVGHLKDQYPNQMSGGQQQRLAVARALVVDSSVVLFDEPLSNVDAKVRESLRHELLAMQRELQFAALFVTHDQTEAMSIGHRIAVVNAGRIEQEGSPRDVYERPASRYVSDFVGTTNELHGTVESITEEGGLKVATPVGLITTAKQRQRFSPSDSVVLTFRPEHTSLTSMQPDSPANRWEVERRMTIYLGPDSEEHVEAAGIRFKVRERSTELEPSNGQAWIAVSPHRILAFPAEAA